MTLRPERPADEALVRSLFLTGVGAWMEGRLPPAVVDQQLDARRHGHTASYPGADRHIVVCGTEAVGRLVVDRTSRPWHLVDIALLPEVRDQGVGTDLLARLQHEAAADGTGIELYVDATNPARRLYERCGWTLVRQDRPDVLMQWPAP